ncbi:MAG: glycosyltransferase [Gemmatimonadetes bacterium]|nr:glycosyltransferase [Gemmatimonadota bacterium]
MKICVITFQFPPEVKGGVGTAINRITRNLAASEIGIHVIAPGPHGPEDSFSFIVENGVTVHRTCPSLGNHFGDPTHLRNIADYVARLHDREKFDLFHGVFVFPAGHLATLLSKDMGVPSVISIRGSDIELHRYHWGLFGAVKWTLENAAFVTSVAGTLLEKASSFAQICKKKVIKNAFDPNLFSKQNIEELVKTRGGLRGQIFVKKLKNEKEKGKLVVGTTGIIRPGKSGFSILFQAFEDFHRQYPESHLLLIGDFADSELKKTWLQQFRKRKLIRHISITGRVPHSEVLAWMRQVDVFVLPSLYEGSPNAVLEAMACQRPIISSAVDGVLEIVEDGQDGMLFPSQRSDILCEKLMCLADDHNLRKRLGIAAEHKIREQFSPEKETEIWRDIYRRVIDEYKLESQTSNVIHDKD